MPVLLLLFITVPLVEIYLLIAVGKMVGAIPTICLVVATAAIGVALLRRQGRQALLSAQTKMAAGALPSTELVEGVFLALGGLLLLTPGFATDAIGFACLVPAFRRFLIRKGAARIVVAGSSSFNGHPGFRDRQGHRTFEGEYRREDEDQRNLP